jgi:hypothetical protein
MKKKLLSLFALLCLVLPACIGLVGCGTQSDTQAIISACEQMSTIFRDKGSSTFLAQQNDDVTVSGTYVSFDDFASLVGEQSAAYLCYQISSDFAMIKGAYSNETFKESVKSNNVKFDFTTEESESAFSFSFKNTIDRKQKKITCIFGFNNVVDLKVDINYDFGKGQVLSFDMIARMKVNSDAVSIHSIKYDENSALTIASASIGGYDETQTVELGNIMTSFIQWEKENEAWNSESTLVSDSNGEFRRYFGDIDYATYYTIYQTELGYYSWI